MSSRIKVFLVDDQTLVREGIRTLLSLSDQVLVVGEAIDGQQALERIPSAQADVVLMDVRMPGVNGIEAVTRLRAQNQLPPTIILTTFDDTDTVIAGIRAGAKGYLLKDVTLTALVDAIKVVASGGTLVQPVLTERIAQSVIAAAPTFAASSHPEQLSEREREVLRLMSGGMSNKEIANTLDLSEGTVKNHVSNILAKLGVRDRTRAVLKAMELGWI